MPAGMDGSGVFHGLRLVTAVARSVAVNDSTDKPVEAPARRRPASKRLLSRATWSPPRRGHRRRPSETGRSPRNARTATQIAALAPPCRTKPGRSADRADLLVRKSLVRSDGRPANRAIPKTRLLRSHFQAFLFRPA